MWSAFCQLPTVYYSFIIFFSAIPVYDFLFLATASGVPSATTRPPASPP